MDGLGIRKARKEDQKGIFQIFESRKPHWDKRFAKLYYVDYFENEACSNDEIFIRSIGQEIVSVIGSCPDTWISMPFSWTIGTAI
jgi:hypothetical protein